MPLEEGHGLAAAQEGVLAVLQLAQYSCKLVHKVLRSPGSYSMGVSGPLHEFSFLYLQSTRFLYLLRFQCRGS